MTIRVDATYENGVLKPAVPLPLQEHESVRVTVEQRAGQAADIQSGWTVPTPAAPSLAERIVTRARALPPEALAALPDDLAAQHDHYLYGTPKRPE